MFLSQKYSKYYKSFHILDTVFKFRNNHMFKIKNMSNNIKLILQLKMKGLLKFIKKKTYL